MTAATFYRHCSILLGAGVWQGAKRAGWGRYTADLTHLGARSFLGGAVESDRPNDTANETEPKGAMEP